MKRAICLMAFAPVVLLAACGGDGDDTTTPALTPTVETPQNLSKAEFIQQGDGICAEVNAALGTLTSAGTDVSAAASQRADLYEGMIDRIRGLGKPSDETGLDDFLNAGDDLVAAEKAGSDTASALADFQSAASDYGFQDCGQGPSAPSTSATAPSAPGAPVAPVTPVTPVAPATPAPAPTTPSAPSGGAGTGGGTGGGTSGSGGVGPG
jgi:hypothetical protein